MSTKIEQKVLGISLGSKTLINSRETLRVKDVAVTVDDSQGRTFFDKTSHSDSPDERYNEGELVRAGEKVALSVGFLRRLHITRLS